MTLRRVGAAVVVTVVAVVAGACGGDDEPAISLDGSPRVADDAGIVTEIEHHVIELDGERRYQVSRDLVSFSTYTGELEPMLRREGQYVHVGLDGDTVVWMAGIAAVFPGDPPTVIYDGEVAAVDGRRLVFADGTVLALDEGLDAPEPGVRVVARIDAERDVVIELLG